MAPGPANGPLRDASTSLRPCLGWPREAGSASGKSVTDFSVATNEYRGGEERTEYQVKGRVSPLARSGSLPGFEPRSHSIASATRSQEWSSTPSSRRRYVVVTASDRVVEERADRLDRLPGIAPELRRAVAEDVQPGRLQPSHRRGSGGTGRRTCCPRAPWDQHPPATATPPVPSSPAPCRSRPASAWMASQAGLGSSRRPRLPPLPR